MLLRVEVYPHDGSEGSTLHACKNTCKDGKLLVVGRKESDIVFGTDKSVSRKHLTLHLQSTHKAHKLESPGTEEATRACNESGLGMCVVLEELGAKFGTFIVTQTDYGDNEANNKTGDDSDTGDETDDEGNVNIPMSQATQKFLQKEAASSSKLKKVKSKSQVVLNQLSNKNGQVIIQCGQCGSTLVVTRIALTFCLSQADKKLRELTKQFYKVGAEVTTDCAEMTHLIAPKMVGTAKLIIAWLLNRPVITSAYVDALMARTSPRDDLPVSTEYEPPGQFPFEIESPAVESLSAYTLLSLARDEMEIMCRAAGATVVQIYDMEDSELKNWLSKNQTPSRFFVNTSSRRQKKRVELLRSFDVKAVTMPAVASTVTTRQAQLVDIDGNAILGAETLSDEHAGKPDTEDKELKRQHTPRKRKRETLADPTVEGDIDSGQEKPHAETNEIRATEVIDEEPVEEPPKRPTRRSGRNKQKVPDSESNEEGAEAPHMEEKESMIHKKQEDVVASSVSAVNNDDEGTTAVPTTTESNTRSPSSSNRAKKLEKVGGWFVTPKISNRREYRVPDDEILQTGAVIGPIASTEECSLVVNRQPSTAAKKTMHRSRANGQVKDFKRFRKNSVLVGEVTKVALRAVLPKESERQRQLELTQKELDKAQRHADMLFQDSGGGIRNYFRKTGTTSRRRK